MSVIDCKGMIVSLLERIDGIREERVSAGTKYRLMGLVADIAEVAQGLQEKVLARVSQEVVLDADVDIDYAELSEEVLAKELPELTNTALTYLQCSGNDLTALDVSANTSLVYMACYSNQLATLDLSKNMALEKLLCFKNQISGQNMDALIGSLRQNESEEFCGFYVMDGNEPNQNVCTKSQAAAAKAKGWLPQYWDEDEEVWLEYEGSEPIREKK